MEQNKSWERDFDDFGFVNKDTGRMDGDADTPSELKSFISQLLSSERARLREEWMYQVISDIKTFRENIADHHEKVYKDCPRCIEIEANNKVIRDIISFLTKQL